MTSAAARDADAPRGANPLQAVRQLAAAQAAPYNGVALQRERILQRLRQGPATRAELERECASPSATKRLSELRRAGWPIDRQWIGATAADGRINAQTLYSLADADTAQADLFDPA